MKYKLKVFKLVIVWTCLGVTMTQAQTQEQTQEQGNSSSEKAATYTEEQAVRGQSLYYQHCLACHGEMMTGQDQAPPLTGPQFSAVWKGVPLWSLVERIDTMPPDKPGSLTRAQSVDVLTFILWFNGLPVGTEELNTEQSQLTQVTFQTQASGQ